MRQLRDGEDVDQVEEQLEVRRPSLALRRAQEAKVGDYRHRGLAIGCHPQSMERFDLADVELGEPGGTRSRRIRSCAW